MSNFFIDQTVSNEQTIKFIILKYFSSPKKIISQNYTKNNFFILKKKFPLFWQSIKNKIFIINGKTISFKERIYQKILINGKIYSKIQCGRTYKAFDILKMYDFSKFELKSFVIFCTEKMNSGFSILKFLKKYFYQEYDFLIKTYGKNSENERQTIFKYLNNFLEFPSINGKKLKFYSYTTKFQAQDFYYEYSKLSQQDKLNIFKILEIYLIKQKNKKEMSNQLKKFFPEFYQLINQTYPNYKYFTTKAYLFFNKLKHLLYCKNCQKEVNENKNGVIKQFCSVKCKNEYFKKIQGEKFQKIYGKDWKTCWLSYKKLVIYLTENTYKKFKNKINPLNLPRKHCLFHVDHIIPKIWGFEHKIDPHIIAHWKNLQMLSQSENCSKQGELKIPLNKALQLIQEIKNQLILNKDK